MGRIKTQQVKRETLKLIKENGKEFNTDFNENKKKVEQFLDIRSKKLRNVIAGYVTRLTKTGDYK